LKFLKFSFEISENFILKLFFADGAKDREFSKRKKPLICQFSSALEEVECSNPTVKGDVVLLEGKYWRRKLDSITNEYKKWREFSRQSRKMSRQLDNGYDMLYQDPMNQFGNTASANFAKQTFSNRCRSPSPGLFQDLELYNFSDTLFTTCAEDPKDTCKIINRFLIADLIEFNASFR
jgi:hypothetical protein